MKNTDILEQFKAENSSFKDAMRYDKYFQKQAKTEKITFTYSEKTKEMFSQMKQTNQEQKTTTKPQKDKAIGKASQRRGNGRGCI